MRNDLLSRTATLATIATFFLARALCPPQPSVLAASEPANYYGDFSINGEKGVGQRFPSSPRQQGMGNTSASQESAGVSSEKATEVRTFKRGRSPASLSRSRADSLRKTSSIPSGLLASATSVVAVILLLWRLGSVVWKCLTQTGTPRAGATPRSLSASEDEGQKDVCVEMGLLTIEERATEDRQDVRLEALLVTVAVVGLLLAAAAYFVYSAVTLQTRANTAQPVTGPGELGARELATAMLFAAGGFVFYMYLVVQRLAERPPVPGLPDPYVLFFMFWGIFMVTISVSNSLREGGVESWLLPVFATFLGFTFVYMYWTNLRTFPRSPPRGDDADNGDDSVFQQSPSASTGDE